MGGKGSGRLSNEFKRKTATEIIRAVANGATLKAALAEAGNPLHPDTFRATVLKDDELRKGWDLAKEMRAHAMFDEAVDLAKELKDKTWGKDSAAMVRALDRAITAFFYAAARLSPREYGERAEKVAIVPVHIHTSLNLQGGVSIAKPDSVYHLKANVVDAAYEPSGADDGRAVESPALAPPSEPTDG